jgi:hypothetical protein
LAGIIIGEYFLGNSVNPADTAFHYQAIEGESRQVTITLMSKIGARQLCAWLVDKADVDQNRPEKLQKALQEKRLPSFGHPGRFTNCLNVRLNPVELSNYPNPFDPSSQDPQLNRTRLVFYLTDDSPVKISILDPFGNLVCSKEAQGVKGLNDGAFNSNLTWDGRNGENVAVANGGYICIIRADKTGEEYIRKIAVLKKPQ